MRKPLLSAVVGGLVLCFAAAVTAAAARLPVASGELSAFHFADVDIDPGPFVTTASLDVARDTFLDQRAPNTPNGGLGALASTDGTKRLDLGGIDRRVRNAVTLIAFDFGSICSSASIRSATLELTATGGAARHLSRLVLDVNGSSWSEGTATWNNPPTSRPVATHPAVSTDGTLVTFDVTDTIIDASGRFDREADASRHGWRVSRGHSAVFASRESGTPAPRLVLEVEGC